MLSCLSLNTIEFSMPNPRAIWSRTKICRSFRTRESTDMTTFESSEVQGCWSTIGMSAKDRTLGIDWPEKDRINSAEQKGHRNVSRKTMSGWKTGRENEKQLKSQSHEAAKSVGKSHCNCGKSRLLGTSRRSKTQWETVFCYQEAGASRMT
jgi:hypothetical protein